MTSSAKHSASTPGADLVLPLHYFDNSAMFTNLTMYVNLVFDDVLDPEKLRSSLEELIARDTWRKLGARVRKGQPGPDLHIPRAFSSARPSVSYSHVSYDEAKADHAVASLMPSSASLKPGQVEPAIVGNPEDWADLCCGPEGPKTLADYTSTDRSVTGLRVISFKDATIVVLHWLHAVADAMALKAILDNWVLVLSGRQAEVPLAHGVDEDPLKELGCHPTEPYDLADKALSSLGTASFAIRNGYNIFFGKKQNRTVCVPAAFMAVLRKTAIRELKDAGHEDPFLTDNDILTAWWSRLAFSHLPVNKPVTIMQAMSARRALEKDLLPPEKVYISNCLSFTSVLSTKGEVDKSLGLLAGDIRRGINKHGTREQIEAYQSMVRANAWPLGPMPVLYGVPNMHQVGFSNWGKVKAYLTDFSAAATSGRKRAVYPCFVSQIQTGVQYPDGFLITGQDEHGNYWLEGYRPAGLWGHIENLLKADV